LLRAPFGANAGTLQLRQKLGLEPGTVTGTLAACSKKSWGGVEQGGGWRTGIASYSRQLKTTEGKLTATQLNPLPKLRSDSIIRHRRRDPSRHHVRKPLRIRASVGADRDAGIAVGLIFVVLTNRLLPGGIFLNVESSSVKSSASMGTLSKRSVGGGDQKPA
jgi:hypothetical protein